MPRACSVALAVALLGCNTQAIVIVGVEGVPGGVDALDLAGAAQLRPDRLSPGSHGFDGGGDGHLGIGHAGRP